MFEKIIPVIAAVLVLQFLIRFMQKKKKEKNSQPRNFDYKKKIDQFMKYSNYDEGVNSEKLLIEDIRTGLGKTEFFSGIPEDKREVRRELNLIIDAVTHGIRSKLGSNSTDEMKYNNPEKMFDEIVKVINNYKIK